MIPNEAKLHEELDLLEWTLDGYSSLLDTSKQFAAMSGNEAHYEFHYLAFQHAGMEANIIDGIKKAAATLYQNITDMLKRINEYFFGEGEKAAQDAANGADEALDALNEVDGNTPIPDGSPARDPEALLKALEGGTEFEEVMKENSDLDNALDRIRTAAQKVKDCDTVAKLRSVYTEIKSAADSGTQAVANSLRKTLGKATNAANELRNPKLPKDDDTPEIKASVKQENQENIDEAKDETKKARIIGGVRNKIVGAYNSLSKLSKTIKESPAKSEFKG